ncbi:hypothetical protein JCM10207_002376 [Rhodosporidiobolus poonsookiae]
MFESSRAELGAEYGRSTSAASWRSDESLTANLRRDAAPPEPVQASRSAVLISVQTFELLKAYAPPNRPRSYSYPSSYIPAVRSAQQNLAAQEKLERCLAEANVEFVEAQEEAAARLNGIEAYLQAQGLGDLANKAMEAGEGLVRSLRERRLRRDLESKALPPLPPTTPPPPSIPFPRLPARWAPGTPAEESLANPSTAPGSGTVAPPPSAVPPSTALAGLALEAAKGKKEEREKGEGKEEEEEKVGGFASGGDSEGGSVGEVGEQTSWETVAAEGSK